MLSTFRCGQKIVPRYVSRPSRRSNLILRRRDGGGGGGVELYKSGIRRTLATWRSESSFPVRHPFVFGVAVAGIKTGVADCIVQIFIDGKDPKDLDQKRIALFFAFGTVFCGMWQYALFVKLMPRLVPGAARFAAKPIREKLTDRAGIRGLFLQLFVENGINNPLVYFPTFYTIKAMLDENTYDLRTSIPRGIETWKTNFSTDVPAILKVWVPAQLFNFAFSPMWMRVPFVAAVSFGWTCYVSFRRGAFAK